MEKIKNILIIFILSFIIIFLLLLLTNKSLNASVGDKVVYFTDRNGKKFKKYYKYNGTYYESSNLYTQRDLKYYINVNDKTMDDISNIFIKSFVVTVLFSLLQRSFSEVVFLAASISAITSMTNSLF